MTAEEIRTINIPDTEFGQMANEQNTALLLLAREFVAQYAEAVEISERAYKGAARIADRLEKAARQELLTALKKLT